MAWTAADVTAVEDAIRAKITGNAVAAYRIGDRDLRYYSLESLQALRDNMAAEVSAAAGDNIGSVTFGRQT